MRGRRGVGEQLPVYVADLFNRVADLPRSGDDGLLCFARGVLQFTGSGSDYDIVIGVQ